MVEMIIVMVMIVILRIKNIQVLCILSKKLPILGIITSWKDKDLGQGFDTLPIGAMHKRKYFCPIDVFPYKN